MHELGITRNIVSIVSEHAKGKPVKRVQLEIGRLSAIMPDAVRFCYDVCCKGTELEGSTLEIIEIPGKAHCYECDNDVDLNDVLSACVCGSRNLNRLSGEELNIKEMEVA
tara:strand:- start:2402 stop:2731 length:330 start_codon:yes stop_codon:yes gene_type:complete